MVKRASGTAIVVRIDQDGRGDDQLKERKARVRASCSGPR